MRAFPDNSASITTKTRRRVGLTFLSPFSLRMMTVDCAGCARPILDRFLLHFLDKTWHSGCVKCQICRKLLDEKCFYKEGKIYCREDFYR